MLGQPELDALNWNDPREAFQDAINQIPRTVRYQLENQGWRWMLPSSLRQFPGDSLGFTREPVDHDGDPDHYEYGPDLYDVNGNLIRLGRAEWAHKWGPGGGLPGADRGFFGGGNAYYGDDKWPRGGQGGGQGGGLGGGGIFGKRESLPQSEGINGQSKVSQVAVE